MRGKSPWGPGKGPKFFFENLNFGKKFRKCWCRRDDWCIVLLSVGRTEQRGVVCGDRHLEADCTMKSVSCGV